MSHKPKYDDWDVIFTCGGMHACHKIFEMMIDPDDPIMLQIPAYSGVTAAVSGDHIV